MHFKQEQMIQKLNNYASTKIIQKKYMKRVSLHNYI